MTLCPLDSYSDINWSELRQRELGRQNWRVKSSADWDKKAPSFADRHRRTPYADLFLDRLPLQPHQTVLDVGSGPGTLALPLAERVAQVTAIDFSPTMLKTLAHEASRRGLDNIVTVNCSWEDDWHAFEVPVHDIAIASRALAVNDLEAALRKLNDFANRYVFISDRVGVSPFEVDAFCALGRPFTAGPDYIFTVNILYSMGIFTNIEIIRFARDNEYPSMEDALAAYRWMFADITTSEEDRLRQYIDSNIVSRQGTKVTVRRRNPPQWALIWWDKQQQTEIPQPS